jgi:hypothetical protein
VGLERLRSWNCHDVPAQKSVRSETIRVHLPDDLGTDFLPQLNGHEPGRWIGHTLVGCLKSSGKIVKPGQGAAGKDICVEEGTQY